MAWRFGLLKSMKDPSQVIYSDELLAVIKDCYPKAETHFLVVAKKDISSLKNVKSDDIDLLKYMDKKARELSEKEKKTFMIGYHSLPSMERLHLHVVSDDLDSACLKHAKHWNSFTTSFFIDSKKVINDLETSGKVNLPSVSEANSYLKSKLKCHKCDYLPKNIPDLKRHIVTHKNN